MTNWPDAEQYRAEARQDLRPGETILIGGSSYGLFSVEIIGANVDGRLERVGARVRQYVPGATAWNVRGDLSQAPVVAGPFYGPAGQAEAGRASGVLSRAYDVAAGTHCPCHGYVPEHCPNGWTVDASKTPAA